MTDINNTTVERIKLSLKNKWIPAVIISSTLGTGLVAWRISDKNMEAINYPDNKQTLPFINDKNFTNALNSMTAMLGLNTVFLLIAASRNLSNTRKEKELEKPKPKTPKLG